MIGMIYGNVRLILGAADIRVWLDSKISAHFMLKNYLCKIILILKYEL